MVTAGADWVMTGYNSLTDGTRWRRDDAITLQRVVEQLQSSSDNCCNVAYKAIINF